MRVAACVVLTAAWWLVPVSALKSEAAVTPVEKVVQLLGKLSEQVAEEGAREAAEYDKYACFCKNQADFKQNSIENSDEKIKKHEAVIEKLSTEIADLNADVAALGKKITKLEEDIKKEKKKRDKEHEEYLKADKEVTEAIEACRAAIQALKDSKTDMSKDAKVDLMQVAALSKRYPTNPQLQMITALLEQKPPSYKFQSNDIIKMLQTLLVDFKQNKQQLFEDEFALKEIFDEKVQGMQNEIKFKTAEKKKKAAISDAKTEKKENAQTLEETKAGKEAVEQAMKVLKGFYKGFLQYKPPKSDREGKTVEDRAPETSFSGDYKGNQDASKGIIGLLEVILSDFERTIEKVGEEEKDAEKKFDEFKKETEESTDKKEKEKTKKETGIKEATAAITEAQDANEAAEGLHEAALDELDKLQPMCVDDGESHEERAKKRQEEIESLKEALKILEEYDE